jgi:hypothetical protein
VRSDIELFLADGTRLADMSDDALESLKGSFGKYMAVLGRTEHYRRKNRSNIDLYNQDMGKIDAELERRRALNVIDIGGWPGYVKQVHPVRVLAIWEAHEYTGEFADDVIACIEVGGKRYRCPNDREPTHYVYQDEIYELNMVQFSTWISPSTFKYRPHSTVCLPGRVVKRLVHNTGYQKLVEDPLQDAPWTVLEEEPPTNPGEGSR